MELIVASCNLHKIREFREMFATYPYPIEILSLCQFPQYIAPEETGANFRENAILKAEHAAKHLNCLVIADDSGLVVPSLNGEPGVRSARYAGTERNDLNNLNKLIKAMAHLKDQERTAYYECCLALADPQGLVKCVEGICEGYILEESRGRNGFGYDSIFVKNGYKESFGELAADVKNRVSHRQKAFERISILLQNRSK